MHSPAGKDEPHVLREDAQGVTTLRLNRPAQANALSDAMLAELGRAFDSLAGDTRLRCVVLAAEGRAFCGGHDLREMRARRGSATARRDYLELFTRCSDLMQAIRGLPVPVPVIARVQGVATAAGCQLVAACDLAVAADTARFAVSGIEVGLFCSTPAVALSRNVSASAPSRCWSAGASSTRARRATGGWSTRWCRPMRSMRRWRAWRPASWRSRRPPCVMARRCSIASASCRSTKPIATRPG